MIATFVLTLLSLPDRPLDLRVDAPLDFASVRPADAGRVITCAVWLNSQATDHPDGGLWYGCWSRDNLERGIHFRPGVEPGERQPLIVRGRVRVIRHQGWPGLAPWTEVRLVEAEPVR